MRYLFGNILCEIISTCCTFYFVSVVTLANKLMINGEGDELSLWAIGLHVDRTCCYPQSRRDERGIYPTPATANVSGRRRKVCCNYGMHRGIDKAINVGLWINDHYFNTSSV